jgi:hypothetical protein
MYQVGSALDWVAKTAKDQDPVYFSVVNGTLVLRMPKAVSAEEVRKAQAALDKARRRDPVVQMQLIDPASGRIGREWRRP